MLAPLSLTTQVPDQQIFTGVTPEWSDSGEPEVKVTGGTPVINWLVLGLPFSTAIFRTLPISYPYTRMVTHLLVTVNPSANREVEEDGPTPAEKGRRAPTSANTNQPQDPHQSKDTPQSKDKLPEPGAGDKPEDKPLHQGAEKEPGDEEEEEEESAGGDVKSEQAVSMLGAVTVCSPALATRIHRTLIKVIIPQLHHSLTRKVRHTPD